MEANSNNTQNLGQLLHDAALQGDVTLLHDLLLKDPLLLHRPLNTSPLHIACKLGHMPFMWELMRYCPTLLDELDPTDKSNPLHLAARNGHVEVARSLVATNPSLCFAGDLYGRNPVHVAAVKGQLGVLEELVRTVPAAARERVGVAVSGDTVMHLCAKHNQLEGLRMAVRMVGDGEMLNAANGDGNTVLHVAVANKRTEMVRFLLGDKRLKKNAPNLSGLTARDILEYSGKDANNDDHRLRLILIGARASQSVDIKKEKQKDKHLKWIESQRSSLMVVASLIATMAFQGGINPPGGVWQDDQPANVAIGQSRHVAGSSIMAEKYQKAYEKFVILNTIGLVSSMSSILLLAGGLPFKRLIAGLIMVTMWVAVTAMTAAYGISLIILTPEEDQDILTEVVLPSTYVWIGVMALLLLVHVTKWIVRFLKYLWWVMKKLWSCFTPKHGPRLG